MPDNELIERAKNGDREAWNSLVAAALPKLRGVIRRMIGDPDDTDDLVQDTLLRGYEKIATFRGESAFSTWLIAIGTRAALNHLRDRKAWRWDAQVRIGKHLHGTPEGRAELKAIFESPQHRFDAREHIAFCFTCVGRSLDQDEHAVLMLRDVVGYTNRETGRILGINEPVVRHRLTAARENMQSRFDGLCGLVSKRGICYQCEGLRTTTPEDRRGPAIPGLHPESDSAADSEPADAGEARYHVRLRVIRDRDVDAGTTQVLHDHVWRAMSRYEEARGD